MTSQGFVGAAIRIGGMISVLSCFAYSVHIVAALAGHPMAAGEMWQTDLLGAVEYGAFAVAGVLYAEPIVWFLYQEHSSANMV